MGPTGPIQKKNVVCATRITAIRILSVVSVCCVPHTQMMYMLARKEGQNVRVDQSNRARFRLMNVTQHALCMLRHQLYL